MTFSGFVLVIQEKDLVLLKVVKQRLRLQLRKDKESSAKLDKYRVRIYWYKYIKTQKPGEISFIRAQKFEVRLLNHDRPAMVEISSNPAIYHNEFLFSEVIVNGRSVSKRTRNNVNFLERSFFQAYINRS